MKSRFIALFFLMACEALASDKMELRVGISQNPPLKYTDSTGQNTGLFVELLKEIGTHEGWTLAWHPGSFCQCKEWLEAGKIDVIPNIGYSYKRSLKYQFCKENVISTWAQVYCRPELNINNIMELQGLSIAVQRGDVFINEPRVGFRYLMSQFGMQCKLREVSTYNSVFKLVESGEVDAGIVNRLVGDVNDQKFIVKKAGIVFYPIGLRFAFSKKNPQAGKLAETVDQYIVKWKDDPSSIYFKMIDRFYPIEKPRVIRGIDLIRTFCRLYMPWIIAVAVAIALIVILAIWNIVLNLHLNKQNRLLKKQFEEIKTLQGLIPICYMCKKVKDDKGYWETVEKYITKHSGAKFTHGLCPACIEKYYPDTAKG